MSSNGKKLRHSKRWLIGLIGVFLIVGWWWLADPYTLFRVQVWLLKQGSWSNLDHWIDHGDWYLPYLIEEAGNTTPVRVGQVRLKNRAPDSFEAYRVLSVDTVSDCVRMVLHSIAGDPVGDFRIGHSWLDGTTNSQREQAGRLWREWYRKHRGKLRWDPRRRAYMVLP